MILFLRTSAFLSRADTVRLIEQRESKETRQRREEVPQQTKEVEETGCLRSWMHRSVSRAFKSQTNYWIEMMNSKFVPMMRSLHHRKKKMADDSSVWRPTETQKTRSRFRSRTGSRSRSDPTDHESKSQSRSKDRDRQDRSLNSGRKSRSRSSHRRLPSPKRTTDADIKLDGGDSLESITSQDPVTCSKKGTNTEKVKEEIGSIC